MRGYGQFCPVAKAAEIFAERWTPLVLRELLAGSTRFNDLRRGVPLISPTLLALRLKTLEQGGIVERRKTVTGTGWEYHLTSAGREFGPMIRLLGEWGQRWFQGRLGPHELDVGLLMWDMRRSVRPEQFLGRRVVVQFEFSDVPQSKRHWWLVSEREEVDLCPKNPGYNVDLIVFTDLPTMTRVWLGELSIQAAADQNLMEVHGSREIRRRFPAWVGLSSFAGIKSALTA